MALAALVIGLPIPPSEVEEEDADPLGYLDRPDADLDDLREELRPNLQERFQEWEEACNMEEDSEILTRVYKQTVVLMPFLNGSDIVDEMISRLSDRPSKGHICDALETIVGFCQFQKKTIAAKMEKRRRQQAATVPASMVSAATTATNSPLPNSTTYSPQGHSTTPTAHGGVPFTFRMPPTFGGIDDVD